MDRKAQNCILSHHIQAAVTDHNLFDSREQFFDVDIDARRLTVQLRQFQEQNRGQDLYADIFSRTTSLLLAPDRLVASIR